MVNSEELRYEDSWENYLEGLEIQTFSWNFCIIFKKINIVTNFRLRN